MSFSLLSIADLSDEEARMMLAGLRWGGGKIICPYCGGEKNYAYRNRAIWKCTNCRRQFSVTSQSLFSHRKLSEKTILFGMFLFVNGAKGLSALQLSRDLGCQYKPAFVMGHKFREAIAHYQLGHRLEGNIEIDGCFIGGHAKHENKTLAGMPKRMTRWHYVNRRVVIVMRERRGRTLAFVGKKESEAVGYALKHIKPGSIIHADQAHAFDALAESFDMMRINHKLAFSDNGACTNMAESYFARLRRSMRGVYHHSRGDNLRLYALEQAWREDTRKLSTFGRMEALGRIVLNHEPTRQFKGYWQRKADAKVVRLAAVAKRRKAA